MRGFSTVLVSLAVCATAVAQVLPITIRVSSETAPPGGMAQMKVLMTSPKPITSGNMFIDMSAVSFDSIDGIALFSDMGDVSGAAVVDGSKMNMQFTSPKGTFGANSSYPLMTVSLRLSAGVQNGQIFPVSLNSSASFWHDLLGLTFPVELQAGSITVGGSVSIINVLPGGGAMLPGSTFRILGMGFSQGTRVQLSGLAASSIRYVSPSEMLVTVKEAGVLDGVKIVAQNPDKSSDTYYSYTRGVAVGKSTRLLLARTVPSFSSNTMWEAVVPSMISPLVNADYFTAVAVQNPNYNAATVTIEARSAAGAVTGSTVIALPAGGKISREVSELLGSVLPTGSYLHLTSTMPVQMMGLLGNDRTGVVLPVSMVVINAPVPPPPPIATPTGSKTL